MPTTSDDLRIRLGFAPDDWSTADGVRADAVLASARTVIVTLAGVDAVARAESEDDQPRLDAIDAATMVYAVPIFANPERVLQRRQGADYSVSFADGSEAATGLKEARAILSAAGFGGPVGGAFAVDTVAPLPVVHAPSCASQVGQDCNCGAVIGGYPFFWAGSS